VSATSAVPSSAVVIAAFQKAVSANWERMVGSARRRPAVILANDQQA
jgi:hypothetical protein